MLLDGDTNSLPANLTLDQYAVARVQGDVSDNGGRDRTEALIEGLLVNSYRSMALGEDGPAAGFKLLAQQVWSAYQSRMPEGTARRHRLATLSRTLIRKCAGACSIPKTGEPPEVRAVLRTKLGRTAGNQPADRRQPMRRRKRPQASEPERRCE